MSIKIFTIVARNYLSLALTLGDSVVRHHPEAEFTIFLADGLTDLPATSYSHKLADICEYLQDDLEELRFKYNITEFCTSVKPILFQRLFAQPSAEMVYYLDPDTVLFDRLDPIVDNNAAASILLAPHLLYCRLEDDHTYPEYKHLWEGIFNLGFCGVRRSAGSAKFLEWWNLRLQKYCFADHADGLHTDQKWADYVPVYFRTELEVVPHDGLNVAHWNLDERKLSYLGDKPMVNGKPLLLFHFSGFDFRNRMLTKHVSSNSQSVYFSEAVQRLTQSYRAAVFANGYESHIGIAYKHNYFDDGTPITTIHRRLYREAGGSVSYPQAFSRTGPLYKVLAGAGLVDRSAAAKANYSAATVTGIGRLTRVAQFLMSSFLRVAGPKRYSYLIKLFTRFGRPENHLFLLPGSVAATDPRVAGKSTK